MKTTVTVTAEHLRTQVRADCEECAVARALSETVRSEFCVSVPFEDLFDIQTSDEGHRLLTCSLPAKVKAFIIRADRLDGQGEALATLPLTFTVDIPRKYLR